MAHPPPYSGPALTEDNLPAYDKAELADERALVEKLNACKEEAKVAKEQIDKLTADKKALDKTAPDYKKAAKDIDQRIKALNGTAKKKCKLKHPGCVASDTSSRIPMPKNITDALNTKYAANVDWGQLSTWEGGAYSKGYIPWWTYLDSHGRPAIVAKASSDGVVGPRIKGEYGGGPNNKSGATVGVGVDLGQYSERGFNAILDNSNASTHMLSQEKLDALKKKLAPYYNKWGGEACKYLRDHPLELTTEEVNFLNAASHDEAFKNAKGAYETYAARLKRRGELVAPEKFTDLTSQEQTAIIANGYQYGSPKDTMLKAVATNNRNLIPATREKTYLYNAMPAHSP